VEQGALEAQELATINAVIDAANPDGDTQLGLTAGEARVMMADPHSPVGKDAQQGFGNSPCQGIGAHPCFDALIDHPGFIAHVKDFVNGDRTVMTGGGGVMQRWPGQASGIHHGGPRRWPVETNRNDSNDQNKPERPNDLFTFDNETGTFLCRSVNIMIALNDCPEHGGGTAIVVRSCCPKAALHSADRLLCAMHLTGGLDRSLVPTKATSRTLFKTMRRAIRKPSSTPINTIRGSMARRSARADTWMECRERSRLRWKPATFSYLSTRLCECTSSTTIQLAHKSELAKPVLTACNRHGSTIRQIPGARRNVLISYGPDLDKAWQAPSEVLNRLRPSARALVAPEPAPPKDQAPQAKL
jgi:hypothetical protein